jgi:hypothetical protein
VRDLNPHRDPLALLRADLLAQDRVEEVEVGRLAASGAREQRVELLGDAAEPKPLEVLEYPCADDLAAHRPPPIAAA